MLITDAQVHVWLADRPDRPWRPDGHTYAHRPSYEVSELLADMAAAGVDRAVLVPPSFEGDRNDACLAAARAHPDRFAVMGRIDLRAPDARDLLPGWLEQPGMLGIRMTFGRGLDAPVDDPGIAWFWADAERYGIPVMASAAASLHRLPAVLDRHPGLRLVVDRLGVPHGTTGAALDAPLERLFALARYPNVAVKATGLPEMAAEPPPFPSVHRRLDRVIEVFGPRRVFLASDLTRMPCRYTDVVDLFRTVLAHHPAETAEYVLGRGVSSYLGWAPVPAGSAP